MAQHPTIDKGLKIPSEWNLPNNPTILSGTEDPTVLGVRANLGSLFARTDGTLYLKTGAANTAWTNLGVVPDPPTKEIFYNATNYDANESNYRVRAIGGAGAFRFTFRVPHDFNAITDLVMVCIPEGTVGPVSIDLFSDYAAVGEDAQNHSESDLAFTTSFVANQMTEYSITSVFSALAAGDYCGILIDHQGIGTTVDYLGVRLRYT